MADQVALSRIALTKQPASEANRKPAPRLELPGEDDGPRAPTEPARPAIAGDGLRLELPPAGPDDGVHLELPPEGPDVTPVASPARTLTSAPGLQALTPLALPSVPVDGPPLDEGPRLELPPDPDEPASTLTATRAVLRPTTPLPLLTDAVTTPAHRAVPRERPATDADHLASTPAPAPGWLEAPLEREANWAAGFTGPLTALLIVDLASAGRPGLPLVVVGLQTLLAGAATVMLVKRSRLAWFASAALVAALGLGALWRAVDPWGLAATATIAFGLVALLWPGVSSARFITGVVGGLAALGFFTPDLLDGVGSSRLLGPLRSRSHGALRQRVTWPAVDQRSGVQFGPAPKPWYQTSTPGLVLEPETGAQVFTAALTDGLTFERATLEAITALAEAGVTAVEVGPPVVDETSAFDASATSPFTGRQGRARVQGLFRVGETGTQAFVLAAWARTSRVGANGATFEALTASMRRDPPARPTFESPQARALADRSVVAIVGSPSWAVRVVVGARAAVLVPSALVQDVTELPIAISGVTTRLPLGARRVASGVSVIPTTLAAEAAPLRSFSEAPRLSRVLVRGPGWSGGWLTGPAGALRAVDLQNAVTGPAFDVGGALVGLVLEGERGLELVTVDVLAPALAEVLGTAPPLGAAPTAAPAPLFVAREATEGVERSVDQRAREGVVLVATAAGPTAAVVMARSARGWVLVLPRAALGPEVQTVTVKLAGGPEAPTRPAEVVRLTREVAVLLMEADGLDALNPLPASDGREGDGRRVAFGFRLDPVTGLPTLKSLTGEAVGDTFEADPGPAVSAGPVVTPDGRWTGLRLADGATVIPASTLTELCVAGIRDVVWKVSYEPTGTCQLAATFELEDPLGDATLVAVRIEPGEAPGRSDGPTPRLRAARLTDLVPRDGQAHLLFTLPCFTGPTQLQFEVTSRGETRVTWPQTVRPPVDLPWVQRGRASGSVGAGAPRNTLAVELWENPPRATMKHPCGTAPQLCERACAVDDFDACTFDGRHALSLKEYSRAVNVLDGACGRGELEACVLLPWALAEKKGAKARSRPDATLRPWCEAGLSRACRALDVPGWKRALAPAKEACVESPKDCRPYAELLLAGPRLELDVTRALAALKQACSMADERACGLYARTVLQLDKEDPATVMPLLERACAGGDLTSCTLRAMNPGLGLTMPRSAQVANAWLQEACAKGATDACALVLRP
ncbi:MAG: hypothetical protein SFW67_34410 [Myxococcaceae bacterium]|nr:hypothetical protein [Myxococcaceae bacterium]